MICKKVLFVLCCVIWCCAGDQPADDIRQSVRRLYRIPKTSRFETLRYGLGDAELSLDSTIPVYLVSDRWLLTSASSYDFLHQSARSHNITSGVEIFTATSAVRHPQFRNRHDTPRYDIALIQMNKPVRSFRPVCLPSAQDPVGALTVTWWNDRNPLTQSPVDPLSQGECGRLFPPGTAHLAEGVTEDHTCVSTRIGGCVAGTTYHLTASNTHGKACTALLMGLYVDQATVDSTCKLLMFRVPPYVSWVESVVRP